MTDNSLPATEQPPGSDVCLIEPFFGGSHAQLIRLLHELVVPKAHLCTLPAKKWKWRLRTGALHFASIVPHNLRLLFCSSMLNLAELIALRPDLLSCRKVIYFHENQLAFPIRHEVDRDVQFGWSQLMSCLVADECIWNSHFNLRSFLDGLADCMRLQPPDQTKTTSIDELRKRIEAKSRVIYFPVPIDPSLSAVLSAKSNPTLADDTERPLHILWNHRWEWDKAPDVFFEALFELQSAGLRFVVSVIGEQFGETPPIFEMARQRLSAESVVHWGFLADRSQYFEVLASADLVVSTAVHEFFGVAIVEAIQAGCYPLCPARLVYPEYLPTANLYKTQQQLIKQLRYYCRYPHKLRQHQWSIDLSAFEWQTLESQYRSLLLA